MTWNEKAQSCTTAGPPFSPMHGMPITVNSTVSASPSLRDGLSAGEQCTAVTKESGNVAA